jgi:hypothetical protein
MTIKAGTAALPSPGGGWSFNGSATMSGSAAVLTGTARDETGSVVYPVPQPTSGLHLTFTVQLYGGTGANGLTFALLNPASSKATSIGSDNTGLGFQDLGGVAVALGTTETFLMISNWAALWAGTAGQPSPKVLASAEAIPELRAGPNTVSVQVSPQGGSYLVSVWLDGVLTMRQYAASLTASSLLAFTASTGSQTDVHLVRDAAISTAG